MDELPLDGLPLHDRGRRVRVLSGTLTRLSIALALARDERESDTLVEEIESVTACVADAAARDLDEVSLKASLLRRRVEEHMAPAAGAEVLTLALAASLLRDIEQLNGVFPSSGPTGG